MSKTKGIITPDGKPDNLVNPSFKEAGPTDSGGDQPLRNKDDENPFQKKSSILRSPTIKTTHQKHENLFNPFNKKDRSDSESESYSKVKSSQADGIELNGAVTSQEKVNVAQNSATSNKISALELIVEELKKEIAQLKADNLKLSYELQQRNESGNEMEVETYPQYVTDEEELTRETDWILKKTKKNHKKRKASGSPEVNSSTSEKETNNGQPQPIRNKILVEKSVQNEKPTRRKVKPPPVILSNVDDFNVVKKMLSEKNIKHEIKLLNNKQLKINVDDEDDYRNLSGLLNKTDIEWHSYENKLTRPIRVMARGLHPTCKPDEIKEELSNKGFNIINVVNVTKKVKENGSQLVPLPLFMLSFDNMEDSKKIFDIRHILHMKVKMEAKRRNREIPQCKRCQRFGHTVKFCKREANCVRCAGKHLTADCTIPKTNKPKCSNCHEEHPASYRGCLVAKELKKKRNINTKQNQRGKPELLATSKTVKGFTYSDAAKTASSGPGTVDSVKENDMKAQSKAPLKNQSSKGNQSTKKNQTPIKQTQGLDNTNMLSFIERMMSMMDNITSRLDSLESRYAVKHTNNMPCTSNNVRQKN